VPPPTPFFGRVAEQADATDLICLVLSKKPINTGVSEHPNPEETLDGTHPFPENAYLDTIKTALPGLSKDELVTMLADALAGGGEPPITGDNGGGNTP